MSWIISIAKLKGAKRSIGGWIRALCARRSKENLRRRISRRATGIASFDDCLKGGLQIGRMTEVYTEDTQVASSLGYPILLECQKRGELVLWIDVPQHFDPRRARALGIDLSFLFTLQPATQCDALSMLLQVLQSTKLDWIIIDDLDAAPLGADPHNAALQYAERRRKLAQLSRLTFKHGCTVLCFSRAYIQGNHQRVEARPRLFKSGYFSEAVFWASSDGS